jgi:hypothetical protein
VCVTGVLTSLNAAIEIFPNTYVDEGEPTPVIVYVIQVSQGSAPSSTAGEWLTRRTLPGCTTPALRRAICSRTVPATMAFASTGGGLSYTLDGTAYSNLPPLTVAAMSPNNVITVSGNVNEARCWTQAL